MFLTSFLMNRHTGIGHTSPGQERSTMTRRVAIRDVAAHAGVSYQTVSRVLNDSALVSDRSRHRVLQAMTELEYTPSAPARSLRSGHTSVIGVVMPDIVNPFWSAVVRGIEDAAYPVGYCVMVCSSNQGERETEYLQLLYGHRVAGIIVAAGITAFTPPPAILRAQIPLVGVDGRIAGIDSVLLNNVEAAALAVDYLVGLGHRSIGIITGPLSTTSGRWRLIGYRRALRGAGLPLDPSLQVTGPYSVHAGTVATHAMLARDERPTALIAASNVLTIGAMAAIVAMGLRIPEDLTLIGFDELAWNPGFASPLTTVVQPTHAIGLAAGQLLLDRITKRYTGPARRLYISGRLDIRLSSVNPHLDVAVPPLIQFASTGERVVPR
jgi:DNA-binding LacI/PurR family transcriptional regulator